MKEKTRQHYVPVFYLKNFSKNDIFQVFNVKENKLLPNINIKTQCFEKDFYGKNKEIENWFAKKEKTWSVIINKILSDIEITDEEQDYIKEFVLYQYVRTKDFNEEMHRYYRPVFYQYLENCGINDLGLKAAFWYQLNEYNEEDVFNEKINITFVEKYKIFHQFANKKVLIKKYKTEEKLITSDSPVIFYNQENNLSIGLSDLQQIIIIPISNEYCIFIYNESFYKEYLNKNMILSDSNDEIDFINKVEYIRAKKFIYFNPDYVVDVSKWIEDRRGYALQQDICKNTTGTSVNLKCIISDFKFQL